MCVNKRNCLTPINYGGSHEQATGQISLYTLMKYYTRKRRYGDYLGFADGYLWLVEWLEAEGEYAVEKADPGHCQH